MKKNKTDVLIIGAGLTGLTAAYFLRNKDIRVSIVEARDRLGGRIHTLYKDEQAPQEMGATWIGKKHTTLWRLLEELDLQLFEQILGDRAIFDPISTSPPQVVQLPPNNDPTYRIVGGTSALIEALASPISPHQIHLNQAVQSIRKVQDVFSVQTADTEFEASVVISTLPPNLLLKTISCTPALPTDLQSIMAQTHTWMGESIKVGLNYKEAFWRADNSSGTIISNVGPIPEMYDHSNQEDNSFGLKGFFNGTYFSVSREERLEMILKQLEKYYDKIVHDYISYEETVWRNEAFTFAPYDAHILPHANNGHLAFRRAYLNGQFYIAGAETGLRHPGYMDGAVASGAFVAQEVATIFSRKSNM